MERKMASIRQINEITPIDGADAIVLALVDGWRVIVKKDEFNVGDFCIYCEIDSCLPIKPEFEFLRKSSYKKMVDGSEGFVLRTIKLRGQISQGLIIPVSVLPENTNIEYGIDVSEILGITKYEPPIPAQLAGKVKGRFPSFITKTDEERVQNIPKKYEQFVSSDDKFYATEKLDGSSSTFYYNDGIFGVCSRNLELIESPGNTFWNVARELNLEEKLKSVGKNICLQGELIGEGIQQNRYSIKGQTVRFFNAIDIDSGTKYDLNSFKELMTSLELTSVPIIEGFVLPNSLSEIIQYADGVSELNSNVYREGVVVRDFSNKISFKVISNKFLLNEKI